MRVSKFTVLHPADIVLIDFGTSTSKARVQGRHLAYVLGREDIQARDHHLLVIPIFRTPSKQRDVDDIKIRKCDCEGLHFTQYVNASNIQKADRHRVESLIGHVSNKRVRGEINKSILREVGDSDGE